MKQTNFDSMSHYICRQAYIDMYMGKCSAVFKQANIGLWRNCPAHRRHTEWTDYFGVTALPTYSN